MEVSLIAVLCFSETGPLTLCKSHLNTKCPWKCFDPRDR